jgi:hypothetical protein
MHSVGIKEATRRRVDVRMSTQPPPREEPGIYPGQGAPEIPPRSDPQPEMPPRREVPQPDVPRYPQKPSRERPNEPGHSEPEVPGKPPPQNDPPPVLT